MNPIRFLSHLFYDVGKQMTNFRITRTYLTESADVGFAKWTPFIGASEYDVQQANQREILTNEIIFDLDDKSKNYDELLAKLRERGMKFYAYIAGDNRARHIHTYWRDLASMPKHIRENTREKLIREFGCDPALKSDAHLIPIEYAPHWKTGEIKRRYAVNGVPDTDEIDVDTASMNIEDLFPPLPQKSRVCISNRTNTQVAQAIADIIKDTSEPKLFYRPRLNDIVEVREYYDKKTKQTFQAIVPTDAKRVSMILDEIIEFYVISVGQYGQVERQKSPTPNLIQHIIVADAFISALPVLDRLLTFPLPFVVDGKLHIPNHGHDTRFDTYTLKDCPVVTVMDKDNALNIIDKIIDGFCFESERDKNMARAFIITPMARGFYSRMTCRTPIWLIKANRERSGKDYLAGVCGIIYEGQHRESAPISTGHEQDNQELRKTLTSTLMLGCNRFHSSNNRGRLDNAVLEQATTSEHITDRILGKNATVNLDNTLEFSMSANVGLTYTADFFYRCRIINLFFCEEDANAREFPIPDLHGYVKQHRAEIVSAIYSLYYHWFNAGAPYGKTPFTSFPEWARVVGGVFDFYGLESPCVHIEADNVGGDIETEHMKHLFTYMAEKHADEPYAISGISAIIQRSEEDIFNHLDFSQKKDQIRFGLIIRKFTGRILGGVKMTLKDPSQKRSTRQMFVFTRKVVMLAMFGHVAPSSKTFLGGKSIEYGDDSQTCPTCPDKVISTPEDCIRAICLQKGRIEYPHDEYRATQERMLQKGDLCHDSPGYVRLLE